MPTKRESTKMFHLHYKELDMGNQEKFRPKHASLQFCELRCLTLLPASTLVEQERVALQERKETIFLQVIAILR